VALATHEVMHLVAIYAIGSTGSLIVRPWSFSFLPLTLNSLHAQPAAPLPFTSRVLVDFAGPALAILLLGLLTVAVRDRLARAVLVANLVILAFYALIEPVDVVLEAAGHDAPPLAWAEFDYGVPLLILLGASWLVTRRAPG
jgi:hypothetical protein